MLSHILNWLSELQSWTTAESPLAFDSHLKPPLSLEIKRQLQALYEVVSHQDHSFTKEAHATIEILVVEILETTLFRTPDLLQTSDLNNDAALHTWIHKSTATLRTIPPETLITLCDRLVELVTRPEATRFYHPHQLTLRAVAREDCFCRRHLCTLLKAYLETHPTAHAVSELLHYTKLFAEPDVCYTGVKWTPDITNNRDEVRYEHGDDTNSEGSEYTMYEVSFPEPQPNPRALYADQGALCWIPAKDLERGLLPQLEPIVLSTTEDQHGEALMIAGRPNSRWQDAPTLLATGQAELSALISRREDVYVLMVRMIDPVRVYWTTGRRWVAVCHHTNAVRPKAHWAPRNQLVFMRDEDLIESITGICSCRQPGVIYGYLRAMAAEASASTSAHETPYSSRGQIHSQSKPTIEDSWNDVMHWVSSIRPRCSSRDNQSLH